METRLKQFSSRCTTTKVVLQTSLCLPPFALIHRKLRKVESEHVPSLILVTPTWQSQAWYPVLLWLLMKEPILLPCQLNLLVNPLGEPTPLPQNQTLQLAACIITGNSWLKKEFHKGLHSL